MQSAHRKFDFSGLNRRVRAWKQADWEEDMKETDVLDSSKGQDAEELEKGEESPPDGKTETSDSEGGSEVGSDSDTEQHKAAADISSFSFGDLARAQASLPSQPRQKNAPTPSDSKGSRQVQSSRETADGQHASKSNSATRLHKRSNKHAPQEMTSKRPVSRKRDVVIEHKPRHRDPRFDSLSGKLNEGSFRKNYAFLDEYREDEMKKLRSRIQFTKAPAAKEKLKRELMSMESRKKADRRKLREREVLEEHKNQEKDLVKQGKKPFYLKKAEQKKRLLVNQFGEMKPREVDHAIQRRRKKLASRDKKELAQLERVDASSRR